jgi:hypothetical protein
MRPARAASDTSCAERRKQLASWILQEARSGADGSASSHSESDAPPDSVIMVRLGGPVRCTGQLCRCGSVGSCRRQAPSAAGLSRRAAVLTKNWRCGSRRRARRGVMMDVQGVCRRFAEERPFSVNTDRPRDRWAGVRPPNPHCSAWLRATRIWVSKSPRRSGGGSSLIPAISAAMVVRR